MAVCVLLVDTAKTSDDVVDEVPKGGELEEEIIGILWRTIVFLYSLRVVFTGAPTHINRGLG